MSVCVREKKGSHCSPSAVSVKEIQKCVIENMFLFIYKIQKKGSKSNPRS